MSNHSLCLEALPQTLAKAMAAIELQLRCKPSYRGSSFLNAWGWPPRGQQILLAGASLVATGGLLGSLLPVAILLLCCTVLVVLPAGRCDDDTQAAPEQGDLCTRQHTNSSPTVCVSGQAVAADNQKAMMVAVQPRAQARLSKRPVQKHPLSLKAPQGLSRTTIQEDTPFPPPNAVTEVQLAERVVQFGKRRQFTYRAFRPRDIYVSRGHSELHVKVPWLEPHQLGETFLDRLNAAISCGSSEPGVTVVGAAVRPGCTLLSLDLAALANTSAAAAGLNSQLHLLDSLTQDLAQTVTRWLRALRVPKPELGACICLHLAGERLTLQHCEDPQSWRIVSREVQEDDAKVVMRCPSVILAPTAPQTTPCLLTAALSAPSSVLAQVAQCLQATSVAAAQPNGVNIIVRACGQCLQAHLRTDAGADATACKASVCSSSTDHDVEECVTAWIEGVAGLTSRDQPLAVLTLELWHGTQAQLATTQVLVCDAGRTDVAAELSELLEGGLHEACSPESSTLQRGQDHVDADAAAAAEAEADSQQLLSDLSIVLAFVKSKHHTLQQQQGLDGSKGVSALLPGSLDLQPALLDLYSKSNQRMPLSLGLGLLSYLTSCGAVATAGVLKTAMLSAAGTDTDMVAAIHAAGNGSDCADQLVGDMGHADGARERAQEAPGGSEPTVSARRVSSSSSSSSGSAMADAPCTSVCSSLSIANPHNVPAPDTYIEAQGGHRHTQRAQRAAWHSSYYWRGGLVACTLLGFPNHAVERRYRRWLAARTVTLEVAWAALMNFMLAAALSRSVQGSVGEVSEVPMALAFAWPYVVVVATMLVSFRTFMHLRQPLWVMCGLGRLLSKVLVIIGMVTSPPSAVVFVHNGVTHLSDGMLPGAGEVLHAQGLKWALRLLDWIASTMYYLAIGVDTSLLGAAVRAGSKVLCNVAAMAGIDMYHRNRFAREQAALKQQ